MIQPYAPDARDWIQALEAGQQASMTRRRDQATQDIGARLMTGDRRGAAAAAYGGGFLGEGLKLDEAARAEDDRAARAAREAQITEAVQNSDFQGAFTLAGPDKDLAEYVDRAAKHAKETTDLIAEAADYLDSLNVDDATAQEIYQTQVAPYLISRKLPPDRINGFRATAANRAIVKRDALGLKDYLAQTLREREFALRQEDTSADNSRADRTIGETERHNKASEGVARGQLGVAQGGLGLRREAHQARMKAGGYGTPGVGKVLGPDLDPNEWEDAN